MGVFRKINIFWGMKIKWIFFGGHHKIGLYLEVISMHFKVFSLDQGTELGIFFWVAKISNIFLGCLKFPFSRDLTISHLDLSHFALCIMGN